MSALDAIHEFIRVHEDCEGRPRFLMIKPPLDDGTITVTYHCDDCGAEEDINVTPADANEMCVNAGFDPEEVKRSVRESLDREKDIEKGKGQK
jgi:hypothetical protein